MMYNLTIKTPYNVIYLMVDNVNTPDIKEILSQPWVSEVNIEVNTRDFDENGRFKRLVRVENVVNGRNGRDDNAKTS